MFFGITLFTLLNFNDIYQLLNKNILNLLSNFAGK